MEKVETLAQEVCAQEGCYLYDLDFVGAGKGRTLRVFIDKDSGVGIEDCSNVSKGLNAQLDAEDTVPGGAYNLEVSTPGLDRHLRKPWHFQKVVGKKIWIRSRVPFGNLGMSAPRWQNTKQLEETLSAADESSISFELNEGVLKVPLDSLEKAHLVFDMKKVPKK